MRQRLGLAGALLKDPALLVLDEPVNGLDPAGIREIRELLRALGAEGRTVFLSSHLLSEVEQTCDRVAIIDRGRLVLSGRVDDVLAEAARPSLLVGLDDTVAAGEVLRRAGLDVEPAGDLVAGGAAPYGGGPRDEAAGRRRAVRERAAARRGLAGGAVPQHHRTHR